MNNRYCLVTGANGFVGSKLMLTLQSKSAFIKGAVRSKANCSLLHDNYLEVGTIDHTTNWTTALQGVEVVIHTAARVHVMQDETADIFQDYRCVNTLGTINLAKQAVASGVKRFIFISSIKVNGESTKAYEPLNSIDPRKPQDSYGQSKSDAEEQLMELAGATGLEVVIIRPTLVYGPGVKANFESMMKLVSKGLPLPFGCITDNKRSLVSVSNLVDLIITCIDHPKAPNQVFLVSDEHDVSTSEMVREMAKSLNMPEWQLPIPKWCYSLLGKIFGKQDVVDRLLGSLIVDITNTKDILGWTPPQTLEEGFRETAEAFLWSKDNKK